jgi:hypothetical protein
VKSSDNTPNGFLEIGPLEGRVEREFSAIHRQPTREEIDAEIKKWMAGQPSKLTVKPDRPRPEPEPEPMPAGYHYEEAE